MVGLMYVYVLKSQSARKSYVGLTDDVRRRLHEHNSGRHAYTKRHMPWIIVHHERCATLNDARTREKYLKSAAGRRFLKVNVFKS